MRMAFPMLVCLASACSPATGSNDQSSDDNPAWPPESPAEVRRFELPKSLLGNWTLSTPRNDSAPLAIRFSDTEVVQDWSQLALDGKPYSRTGQITDIIAYPDQHTLMVHAVPLTGMYLQRGEAGEICLLEPVQQAGQPTAKRACYRREPVSAATKAAGV
jgi:hypothetical protein